MNDTCDKEKSSESDDALAADESAAEESPVSPTVRYQNPRESRSAIRREAIVASFVTDPAQQLKQEEEQQQHHAQLEEEEICNEDKESMMATEYQPPSVFSAFSKRVPTGNDAEDEEYPTWGPAAVPNIVPPSPMPPAMTSPPPMESIPGAFMGAPGQALQPALAFTKSQLRNSIQQHRCSDDSGPSPRPPTSIRSSPRPPVEEDQQQRTTSTSSLVQATEVSSENFNNTVQPTGQAVEVDPQDLESQEHRAAARTQQQQQRKLFWRGSCMIIGLGIVVSILLVIVLTVDRQQQQSSSSSHNQPQQNFESSSDNQEEEEEEENGTAATTSILEPALEPATLIDDLPGYTLQSLEDPFSPQAEAFVWLERHPNITNLDQRRRTQLFALATIYYSFDGPSWPLGLHKDWLDYTKHECDWYSNLLGAFSWEGNVKFTYGEKGFACDEGGNYIQLRMASAAKFRYRLNNITIPAEFALLTSLTDIRLNDNGFNGIATPYLFPPSFYQLTNLQRLHLNKNQFNTQLPTQLGLLTSLTTLRLEKSYFTGTLPSELGLLVKLEALDLHVNELTGGVPSELGQLRALKKLRLESNQLSGHLPEELADLTNLSELHLKSNNFSGSLPLRIGGTQQDQLAQLRLDDNPLLSGTLETHLCHMEAPGCTFINFDNKTRDCVLAFDCSASLCGCHCGCSSNLSNSTNGP